MLWDFITTLRDVGEVIIRSTRSIVRLINCEFGISFALQVSKINPRMPPLVGGGEFSVFEKGAGSDVFDEVYSPDSDM